LAALLENGQPVRDDGPIDSIGVAIDSAAGRQPGAKLGVVRRPTETQLPQPGPRRPVPCAARHLKAFVRIAER
jgi:hypothetical protein